MKLTFLGTGTSQGVPVIACRCRVCTSSDPRDQHLRSSALVQTDEGKNILIDIGPDFRTQMLREQITHLDGILITHAHRDHVAGLDDIRSFNYVQHEYMNVYGNREALETLRRDYAYIFSEHEYPGLPEAMLHQVDGSEPFSVAGVQVVPVRTLHKNLPILAYRIGGLGYITDTNYISEEELQKLAGVDVLVVNALRKEPHFSHFSLPEALEVVDALQPREAYLTHVSHQLGLVAEVEPELPSHVHIACDGMQVDIL